MDKAKARKMYELTTRLSSVNANELSEQQLSERNSMITRLQEEMTKMREGSEESESLMKQKNRWWENPESLRKELNDPIGGVSPENDNAPSSIFSKKYPVRQSSLRHPLNLVTQGMAEDGHEDMNGASASGAVHYNVGKLSKEIGTDPRQLKIAIQRSITGNPTRQDTLTVANAFISILKTGDDQTIQNIANIIKAGNPRKDSAQESTATKEIKIEEVYEEINTEAYDRLRKVFDFSNYKG